MVVQVVSAARTLALMTLVALFTVAAAAQDADDPIVISLDDTQVTLSEFEERFEITIRSLAAQQGMPLTDETREMFAGFRLNFLEQRATELVLMQEADDRGIEVTEADVDAEIERIRANFETEEQFQDVLEQAGFTDEAQLKTVIQESELVRQVAEALQADIEISDEAIEAWYEENRAQMERGEQVCASHILLETLDEAEEVKAELDAEADFATLAQERSMDPGSGAQGGDLGCFERGQMVPEFEEAAFTAELNEVTEPVESDFGFHLILVSERHDAETIPLDEVRGEIREQLAQEQLGDKIEEVREASTVETFPEHLGIEEPEEIEDPLELEVEPEEDDGE